jgi:hypothetical protein
MLRLRIDSPYPGESMSSFLSRTAQFYAMPTTALLKELVEGQNWSALDRRDVDLAPSSVLERRLSEVVPDWKSPLDEHQGFMAWTLAQRQRCTYCPTCFLEDLSMGRTPYFRNDWIPALVTTCWKHGTPLFDWENVYSGAWRRWPKSWLYKADNVANDIPIFMRNHLESLEQLHTVEASEAYVFDGISISQSLNYLKQLQRLLEKPSAAPMPEPEVFRSTHGTFQHNARELVRFATRHEIGHGEPPIAMAACSLEESEWFGPLPVRAARRHWEFLDFGIRLTGCIRWRRRYLTFVARTLIGIDRFGAIFPSESAVPSLPWREWWKRVVFPRLGPRQQESMDWFMRTCLQDL